MKRMMTYLKPYRLLIIVSILLLFVQSFADLKLPNYMSQIVDVGIQQSGLTQATPKKVSNESMAFLTAIFPSQKAEEFLLFFDEESDGFYLKETVNGDEVDYRLGEAVWTLMNFDIDGVNNGFDDTEASFDYQKLLSLTPMLHVIPDEVKQAAYTKTFNIEDALKMQSAVVLGRLLYEDAGYNLHQLQQEYIIISGLKMLGITLLGILASIAVVYLSSKIGAGITKDLRKAVFSKVQEFSEHEFDSFSSSSLVVRTTNDINQIQMLFTFGLRVIVSAPIMAIGGLLMIQGHQTNLSWIIVVACVTLMLLFVVIFIFVVPKFKKMQAYIDRLNLITRENLTGIMVIRAFDNQEFESARFAKANKDHANVMLFINRVMTLMMPLLMFIMNATILAILWFGANSVSKGTLQIGDLMAFMQYAMQIISSFLMIAMMFVFIPRALVSINRVDEVLSTELSIKDPKDAKAFDESKQGVVVFDNVSFKYQDADQNVLEQISFTAKPGKTTAIIGSTGSGKSTLMKLILRFFDVSSGEVSVNGVNVREVRQEALREMIAYVPQKTMLLSGTVGSNVGYGNENATTQDLLTALDIAQAQFVLDSDEGLDMPIAQEATNVSGGQKQRLSIARAVAKKAPILLFDDSFSALDFKTDAALRKRLGQELANATVIIVAQRINTIMDADQIIVLDEGKMVGKGTHHQLLKECEAYYQIASSQLSKEELRHE